MAAPVLLKLFSAQTQYSSLSAEPTTWRSAESFLKKTIAGARQDFSG
jgi:hypothetical protein